MLEKVSQLLRVGRFHRWEPGRATSKLARLTLIYGRNAAGKSTLVRTLRAAAAGSAADLLLDHTLDATQPPQVALDFTAGPYRFDGTAWRGTAPKLLVFDRKFVEDNVFVGQLSTKKHRTQILQIALGAEEVALAHNLDKLSKQGRALAQQATPHDKLIKAMAARHGMTETAFVALAPIADVAGKRAALELRGKDATIDRELAHRAQPQALPAIPRLDFAVLGTLLATTASAAAAAATKAVREHLDKRLRGNGEAWVRAGLAHADGETCPFCGQDVTDNALIAAFDAHFDRTYVDLAGAIDIALAAARGIAQWWEAAVRTHAANAAPLAAWADLEPPADARPRLDPDAGDAALVSRELAALLEAKQKRPMQAAPTTKLAAIEAAYARLAKTAAAYDAAVTKLRVAITNRLRAAAQGGKDAAAIAAERRLLEAVGDRYAEPVVDALAERARIDEEVGRIATAKQHAVDEMQRRKLGQLADFTQRMNALLGMLCADFTLEELETERAGGTTGARFTLRIPAGRLAVANANDEQKLARVLSDGDRSTLALALFLLALERGEHAGELAELIVVFDDPMTSQDAQRSEATAEQITRLAKRVDQVIVVSHLAPFLLQVAYDWRRHGGAAGELAELELDRAAFGLRAWSATEHATDEDARRLAELRAFAADPASDAFAPRMHGELRKVLEGHVRATRPQLYANNASLTLETLIRRLRADPALLASARWTADELDELDRLTAFSARAETANAPAPESIRAMARRALALVDR